MSKGILALIIALLALALAGCVYFRHQIWQFLLKIWAGYQPTAPPSAPTTTAK